MSQLKNIKIAVPTYRDSIPSTKQDVKLTPFKVGDEKVLLMASESKDPQQMVDSLKSVLSNCVEGVDVNKLASFDLEYLFLKLRSISVGESVDVGIKCAHCEAINNVNVDLSSIKVETPENHNNIIKIDNDIGFKMKYPDVSEIAVGDIDDFENILNVIINSVETVYYGEEVIEVGIDEKNDLKDIINNLTSTQFQPFQEFFTTMPKVKKDIIFKCKECGEDNKQVLEGLASFFS